MDIFDVLPETPLSKYDGGFTYHCRYLTYEDLSLGNNFDVYYRYFKEKIKGRFVTFLPTEITYSNKLIAKELRELFLNDRLLDKVISFLNTSLSSTLLQWLSCCLTLIKRQMR